MSCDVYARAGTTGARGFLVAAFLAAPALLFAFPSPPSGLSGAPGEGTCAGCHNGAANPTGTVSVAFPGGLTYTPGVMQAVTVTVAETGKTRWGFELSVRTSSNAQAGTLATVDANTQVLNSGGIQYLAETSAGTHTGTANTVSYNFNWTPPATASGNLTFFVVGLACNNDGGTNGDDTLTTTAVLSPAAGGGNETLALNPTSLTFASSGGAVPPTQTFNVSSSGASIAFTTSVSTTTGAGWLAAVPTGASTPMDVTVSVNPAGLANGTYNGTVSVASNAATNSPQTVAVTLSVTNAPPPQPMLILNPTSLTFNSMSGGAVSPQNVQVTSNTSALMFTTMVSTSSGNNWLSVDTPSGTTPATVAVSANVSGLAPGTYTGSVVFTASGATNSPLTLGVTLMVGPQQPPPGSPGPLQFSFSVVDRQSSGGSDSLLLSGRGSIDANGNLSGSGRYTEYSSSGEERRHVVAMGTWTAKDFVSFSPPSSSGGRRVRGGVLEITVQLMPQGGSTMTGTMRIAATGSQRGVSLDIDGGSSFAPSGVGFVSIVSSAPATGGGGDDGEGDDDGGGGGGDSSGRDR